MTKFSDNFLSDEDMRLLDMPGVIFRLKTEAINGTLSRDDLAHLKRELEQFRRAEEGDRARPDLYSPELNAPSVANQYGLPTPFMPPETHRPDRVENPEVMGYMRNVSQRLEDEQITSALLHQMGTDADLPLPPPTLRDEIAAAASLYTSEQS